MLGRQGATVETARDAQEAIALARQTTTTRPSSTSACPTSTVTRRTATPRGPARGADHPHDRLRLRPQPLDRQGSPGRAPHGPLQTLPRRPPSRSDRRSPPTPPRSSRPSGDRRSVVHPHPTPPTTASAPEVPPHDRLTWLDPPRARRRPPGPVRPLLNLMHSTGMPEKLLDALSLALLLATVVALPFLIGLGPWTTWVAAGARAYACLCLALSLVALPLVTLIRAFRTTPKGVSTRTREARPELDGVSTAWSARGILAPEAARQPVAPRPEGGMRDPPAGPPAGPRRVDAWSRSAIPTSPDATAGSSSSWSSRKPRGGRPTSSSSPATCSTTKARMTGSSR